MGCDYDTCHTTRRHASFNPRTHMGCDSLGGQLYHPRVVSIHAPTWGATYCFFISDAKVLSFNPRTHMGCDRNTPYVHQSFQCFNPRTHMGCDVMIVVRPSTTEVSIHAPTWGATHLQQYNYLYKQFQSTHPHGVRRELMPHSY